MTDGSGNVLLLGGYLNQNTAEIVPRKKKEEEKKTTLVRIIVSFQTDS